MICQQTVLLHLMTFWFALESSENNVSNGPDGILVHYLHNYRHSIAYPIFLLFRRSLDEGTINAIWKICSVIPIVKLMILMMFLTTGLSLFLYILLQNYLNPLFSLISREVSNHIINYNQNGFRPGKSTITSSISFISFILNCF